MLTLSWFEGTVSDLRFALRGLRRRPGFTAVAVISLAVGIGFNTAVFSVLNAVFLSSLSGVQDPESLVHVDGRHSYAAYLRVRDGMSSLRGAAAWQPVPADIGYEDYALRSVVPAVSTTYFSVLGVQPAHGRLFDARVDGDDTPAVVLGYDFWRDALGGDPDVLGRTIAVNGDTATIVGIVPRSFHGVERPPLWITAGMASRARTAADPSTISTSGGWRLLGRLREGVPLDRAAAELQLIHAEAPGLFTTTPGLSPEGARWEGATSPEKQIEFLMVVVLPLVVVALVLWVGCSNVANLLLARAAARRRELAVRSAAGASAGRLLRLLLVESLLLALLGGVLGLLAALWTLDLAWATFPQFASIAADLDARVLLYTGGISLLATVLFGLAPALYASRVDVAPVLKTSSESRAGAGGRRTRMFFLVTQFAASTALLLVAGTFARTLVATHLGSMADRLDYMAVAYVETRAATPDAREAFWHGLREQLRATPGVVSATILRAGESRARLAPDGMESPADDAPVVVQHTDGEFLRTVGAAIVAGSAAERGTTPTGVLVNERAATRFWRDAPAVGQRVTIDGIGPGLVTGVIADGNDAATVYLPGDDAAVASANVLVRTAPRSATMLATLRQLFHGVSPDSTAMQVATLREAGTGDLRRITRLALVVATIVLLLAAVGLYGSVSFLVSQRSREIAIRTALGASRGAVLRHVARDGLTVVTAGAAAGLVLSAGGFRFMSGMFFPRWTLDPWTVAGVLCVFALTTFAACYLPARRALRVAPMTVLRSE